VEVYPHSFVTSVLGGDIGLRDTPAALPPGKESLIKQKTVWAPGSVQMFWRKYKSFAHG